MHLTEMNQVTGPVMAPGMAPRGMARREAGLPRDLQMDHLMDPVVMDLETTEGEPQLQVLRDRLGGALRDRPPIRRLRKAAAEEEVAPEEAVVEETPPATGRRT